MFELVDVNYDNLNQKTDHGLLVITLIIICDKLIILLRVYFILWWCSEIVIFPLLGVFLLKNKFVIMINNDSFHGN